MESLLQQLQRRGSGGEAGGGDQQSRSSTGHGKAVSFEEEGHTRSSKVQMTPAQAGRENQHHGEGRDLPRRSSDGHREAAVAAATYAINNLRNATTRSKSHGEDSAPKQGTRAGRNRDEYQNRGGGKPPTSSAPLRQPSLSSATNRQPTSAADHDSETSEMKKIQKRYEKMMGSILEWENGKKMKAKRRLDKRERRIELRRAMAAQEYRNEVEKIDQIAGGARALATERKKEDELKAREKAGSRRLRGRKTASHFLCFRVRRR